MPATLETQNNPRRFPYAGNGVFQKMCDGSPDSTQRRLADLIFARNACRRLGDSHAQIPMRVARVFFTHNQSPRVGKRLHWLRGQIRATRELWIERELNR